MHTAQQIAAGRSSRRWRRAGRLLLALRAPGGPRGAGPTVRPETGRLAVDSAAPEAVAPVGAVAAAVGSVAVAPAGAAAATVTPTAAAAAAEPRAEGVAALAAVLTAAPVTALSWAEAVAAVVSVALWPVETSRAGAEKSAAASSGVGAAAAAAAAAVAGSRAAVVAMAASRMLVAPPVLPRGRHVGRPECPGRRAPKACAGPGALPGTVGAVTHGPEMRLH